MTRIQGTRAQTSRMKDVRYSVLVQVELQQAEDYWQVKGCTAYADGMQKPLPVISHQFGSRKAATQAMKQHARKHLCVDASEAKTFIRWQFVLWFAPFPMMRRRSRCGDMGNLVTEPDDTAALVTSV